MHLPVFYPVFLISFLISFSISSAELHEKDIVQGSSEQTAFNFLADVSVAASHSLPFQNHANLALGIQSYIYSFLYSHSFCFHMCVCCTGNNAIDAITSNSVDWSVSSTSLTEQQYQQNKDV